MKNTKLFIVDTLVSYRMRYAIEAESLDHALDEVTMKDSGNENDAFDEMGQICLGEQIIDGRKISRKKLDKLFAMMEKDGEAMSHDVDSAIRRINYDE